MSKTAPNLPTSLFGVGLRHPHYYYVLENLPRVGWFEVHSENFFMEGGAGLHFLEKVRQHYPLSLHGVGLSLGSKSGPEKEHLTRLKQLVDRIDPFLVSEHLSWSRLEGVYMPDLLPVPYTQETLNVMRDNIDQMQSFLGREILIENPSTYFEYSTSSLPEADFLIELCQKAGCKLLLDINNVFVSCQNHGYDSPTYINQIPPSLVGEIHLAGHSLKKIDDSTHLRIDDHSAAVSEDVWALYKQFISEGNLPPTLIEWDTHIPDFDVLMEEAKKAEEICRR